MTRQRTKAVHLTVTNPFTSVHIRRCRSGGERVREVPRTLSLLSDLRRVLYVFTAKDGRRRRLHEVEIGELPLEAP